MKIGLTAGSQTDEAESPDGVNAKGRVGEHDAGKDDAALPLDALQGYSICQSRWESI